MFTGYTLLAHKSSNDNSSSLIKLTDQSSAAGGRMIGRIRPIVARRAGTCLDGRAKWN